MRHPVTGTVQLDSEGQTLFDSNPHEYYQGWTSNNPDRAGWPMSNNPYPRNTNEFRAFNVGWNHRTEIRDSEQEGTDHT